MRLIVPYCGIESRVSKGKPCPAGLLEGRAKGVGPARRLSLLTPQEARDWVAYLQTTRKLKAASINLRLSALRSLARHHGWELRVRGPRQEKPPLEALDSLERGRLLDALEGEHWTDKRNVALATSDGPRRAGCAVTESVHEGGRSAESPPGVILITALNLQPVNAEAEIP